MRGFSWMPCGVYPRFGTLGKSIRQGKIRGLKLFMPLDACFVNEPILPQVPMPVAISANGDLEQVTDVQLAKFAELIYGRMGIGVAPQKKMLPSNRLRRRLRETGIASFGDYYQHIVRLPAGDAEWDALPRKSPRTRPISFATKPSGTGSAGPTWRAAPRGNRPAGPR